MSLFSQNKARLGVVGSLGFEPRIANAPGWYTKPMYPTQNQSTQQSEQTKTESVYDPKEIQTKSESLAIRRPQPEVRNQLEIDKTIEKAQIEGKATNTLLGFRHRLRQLSRTCDLMNPDDVKKTIGYSKLSNSSKCSFALAYEWFTKTNGLTWQKPRYKWVLNPIRIPTTTQVERIISASTEKYATIFHLMKEIGVEGEELHQTKRDQYDKANAVIAIKGLKGHDSNNYKLKPYMSQMLEMYLLKYTADYPFPRPKSMQEMWHSARDKASRIHNDPELKKIPMKSLRNYSGVQVYFKSDKCPITVKRHLRHRKLETTMHYLRGIVINGEEEYTVKTANNIKEATALLEAGFTYIQDIDGIKLCRKRK